MSPDRYAATLLEAIPDGTYGQAEHSPWTPEEQADRRPWTPEEQAQHRAELCTNFRLKNDYDPKPNPRRKRSN